MFRFLSCISNNFSFKENVPYVQNLLTLNLSYPTRSDGTAHHTLEIDKAAMFPVLMDYYYRIRNYYY